MSKKTIRMIVVCDLRKMSKKLEDNCIAVHEFFPPIEPGHTKPGDPCDILGGAHGRYLNVPELIRYIADMLES